MSWTHRVALLVLSTFLVTVRSISWQRAADDEFRIGIGIADVTGPPAGVGMMGYAKAEQVNHGIHTRLFSRAFIICDEVNCIVFVTADIGMLDTAVKIKVIERLEAEFGGIYHDKNVILSGTHTHSGPAGYLQYVLFQFTNLGFIEITFNAIVDGIVQSIKEAHDNIVPGRMFYTEGTVMNANINRSPLSYLANPRWEREMYEYDVDKTMQLIRFEDLAGSPIGMLNWFAVHPTSMNNTNKLTSGDNKGVASMIFERRMNPGALMGKGKFVAGFASSNLGDVSPNILGARCQDTGEVCDSLTSTCNGNSKLCIASGPGRDMFESTWIIGERQSNAAWNLFNDVASQKPIRGSVRFAHQYVNMSNYELEIMAPNGSQILVHTCPPAMGYSFAAGTTDGPGEFDFTQINWPYDWQPHVVDTQLAVIGDIAIAAVPGEMTTMSGRRLRRVLLDVMMQYGIQDPVAVTAGLCNTYSDYIATFEEYQIQRYEAASTIYGPHTLAAYEDQYRNLAMQLMEIGAHPQNNFRTESSYMYVERLDEETGTWTVVANDADWETK
ncbi:unnamed protein product [Cyprideis torosa]|uniref:Neutral ceramidase n=1 Tax=Cyprideis torosa TaxID=163714 RepID=A0A7R8W5I4_9CRUS|nr:unnamed protein product [Cyprideis torosa]CAG0885332.1 unnamed protein product [Cyprideis torosa]